MICTPFSGQPEKGVILCVIHLSTSLNVLSYIDKEDGRLFFKAGGGITAQSDWQKEYQEIKEKTYVPIC